LQIAVIEKNRERGSSVWKSFPLKDECAILPEEALGKVVGRLNREWGVRDD
jgi:hypothetical protein